MEILRKMARSWCSLARSRPYWPLRAKHGIAEAGEEFFDGGEEFLFVIDKEQTKWLHGLVFHLPGGSKR